MNGLLQPHHGAIFRCPLCEWTYSVAPIHIPEEALAGQFGPGVMTMSANNVRLQQTERELHDHLSQHTLVQWITKVRALEQQLQEQKTDG